MILVTGTSGTAGRAVMQALDDAGCSEVLAATRKAEPGSGERRLDLADAATFEPALNGVQALFLMLPPGLSDARSRMRRLLHDARAAGVQRITFLSVRNADRLTFLPHRGIEQEVEASGLRSTHLRPNDWMQNFATQPLYRNEITRGELWLRTGGHSPAISM